MAAEDAKVVLLVTLKFASTEDRDEVLGAFKPLAAHVTANEEGALSYGLLLSSADPLEAVIYERYVSQSYLDSVHCSSEPFKAFFGQYLADDAPWRKNHQLEVSVQSYSEAGIGHMLR